MHQHPTADMLMRCQRCAHACKQGQIHACQHAPASMSMSDLMSTCMTSISMLMCVLAWHGRPSTNSSGRATAPSTSMTLHAATAHKPRRRTNNEDDELTHPLLGDQPTLQLIQPRDGAGEPTHFPKTVSHSFLPFGIMVLKASSARGSKFCCFSSDSLACAWNGRKA